MIGQRKCLYFAEASTLYVFMIPGVVKKDAENLPALFPDELRMNLLADGIPGEVIARGAAVEPFQLTKAQDLRVLGSMNDLSHYYGSCIEMAGGLALPDFGTMDREMNRIPTAMLSMDRSVNVLRRQLLV